MSAFDQAMLLPFLDGVPGNAAAYVKIQEDFPHTLKWNEDDWVMLRISYYCGVIKDPKSAWLHDIYKNRCLYNVGKTVKMLEDLYVF